MTSKTLRMIGGLAMAAAGVLGFALGLTISIENSPMVTHPLCKGQLLLVNYCDPLTHNVSGSYLVSLVGFVVGGIVTFILGCVVFGFAVNE